MEEARTEPNVLTTVASLRLLPRPSRYLKKTQQEPTYTRVVLYNNKNIKKTIYFLSL